MTKAILDPEEQELLEAHESGESESDVDVDRRKYRVRRTTQHGLIASMGSALTPCATNPDRRAR